MAISDAVNKAYPSREDLQSALGRLASAGLVDPTRLKLTRAGRKVPRRGPEEWSRAVDYLNQRVDLPDPGANWEVDASVYESAIQTYLDRYS
jgi:hypothetical protein